MVHSMKTLIGMAKLHANWEVEKDKCFAWCKDNGDHRWREDELGFLNHMYNSYFNTGAPITSFLYKLDCENIKVILRYCNEVLCLGEDRFVDDGREIEKRIHRWNVLDDEGNVIDELKVVDWVVVTKK